MSASAQRPERNSKMTPEERASKQTEMMTKQLDLTAEQQAKVMEINLKYSQQMANQVAQAKEEMAADRDNMKSQMAAKDTEIKQVLTPEQYQQWQDKRQEMRKDMTKKGMTKKDMTKKDMKKNHDKKFKKSNGSKEQN